MRRRAGISVVMVVFAILGTTVTVLAALASLVWWAYKRGHTAGEASSGNKAKVEGLERQLAETRRDLAALQSRHPRN
jgi:hypothetical protein